MLKSVSSRSLCGSACGVGFDISLSSKQDLAAFASSDRPNKPLSASELSVLKSSVPRSDPRQKQIWDGARTDLGDATISHPLYSMPKMCAWGGGIDLLLLSGQLPGALQRSGLCGNDQQDPFPTHRWVLVSTAKGVLVIRPLAAISALHSSPVFASLCGHSSARLRLVSTEKVSDLHREI